MQSIPTTSREDHIYHVYNRGVEKRNIFSSEQDYLRFIGNLYEFNDRAPALNAGYRFRNIPIEVRLQYAQKDPIVRILSFCLMPNHYHLMLQERREGGITAFMRKLGTGYTNYFNLKHDRVGHLFQGKFKSILLKQDAHLTHLPHYIHLNPLDLSLPEWRERTVRDVEKALHFLRAYRWSSFSDYIGKKNFPSVTDREFLTRYIGPPESFLQNTKEWMHDARFDLVRGVTIE